MKRVEVIFVFICTKVIMTIFLLGTVFVYIVPSKNSHNNLCTNKHKCNLYTFHYTGTYKKSPII